MKMIDKWFLEEQKQRVIFHNPEIKICRFCWISSTYLHSAGRTLISDFFVKSFIVVVSENFLSFFGHQILTEVK